MDRSAVFELETAKQRDGAAREIVRTAFDENIMVLAGAGAGKTHEMITRMVNLVRSGVHIEHMAAITFTKKAAGEMQGRFFDRLQEAAREAPAEERENLRRARQKIDRCYIGTIHSFCGRLLRERSLEAGLPPDFTEIDDREELDLRKTAWQRYLQRCDPEDVKQLQDLGVEPNELSDFFGDLCQFAELNLHRPAVEKPELEAAVEAVTDLITQVEPHIPAQPISDKGYDDCQQAVLESRRFLEYHGLHTDGDRAELLQRFEQLASWDEGKEKWSDKLTYSRWGKRGSDNYAFAQKLGKEWLPELISNTLAPVLADWEAYVYNRTAEFTRPAVDFYEEMRLTEGQLSFQDLLVCTRDLLRDHPGVRAFFQKRYRYLFVDEFQDTDPIQAEILFYLTDTDQLFEKDWTKLIPRPGSLFLVGDGKQSIYRFRRADYETFNLVRRRLEESDSGRIINLQRCFRTFENLCGYVNDAFPEIFQEHGRPHQSPFQELLRIDDKRDDHEDGRVRRITVPYKYRNSSHEIASHDADCIARFIAAMVRGTEEETKATYAERNILPEDVGYGDFMILTRNSTRLHIYANALEQLDIPYDLTGGGQLGESEELRSLLDVMKAVYDPDNPLPLMSYLRGPFVGLSDDDLHTYSRAGGEFSFKSSIPDQLPQHTGQRFVRAYEALEVMEDWLSVLPVSAAIERFLDEQGVLAFSAVQRNGSSRAGTLLKVLALVEEMETQTSSWIEVMNELQEIVDDDSYKVEEMTLEAGARNAHDEPTAVQLMNLHKAKGLEAPVVFLADPYSSGGGSHDPYFHVSRVGEEDPFVVLPVSRHNHFNSGRELLYRPWGWESFAAEEEKFLAAEDTRLLYVAATRAENLLVISRYEDKRGHVKDGYWAPLNGCLEAVPELDECKSAPGVRPDHAVDLEAVERRREEIREVMCQASFQHRTITGETHPAGALGGTGHGQNYGTLVHELFELLISECLTPTRVSGYIDQALQDHAVDEEYKPTVQRAVDRFLGSDLWKQIEETRSSARAVYSEVPFAAADHQTVISGQIDLVMELEQGWHIVDFKTQAAPSPEIIEAVRSQHTEQLRDYRQYWEEITGEFVVETELWLTEEGRRVGVISR